MGQYSDSPRAISEAIYALDPTVELIWKLRRDVDAPDNIKRVYSTLKSKILQVQADAWVINTNSAPGEGNYKGNHTFFVATWHGDRGFKRIGWAAKDDMGNRYKSGAFDMDNVNLFTAASEYGIMQAHEGMHYFGEIQKEGLPRNDKLVNLHNHESYIKEIRSYLNIEENKKILLYAPTFRDSKRDNQEILVDLPSVVGILEKNGEKWICLVRAHNGSSIDFGNINNNLEIIDVSSYGDMADLLLIADVLITDYSSCAGDFVLTGRPCVLAQYDRSDYENNNRTLWFSPEKSGFLIAKNQEEMNAIITHLYDYNHKRIAENVLNYYQTNETGQSSVITAKRILDWINSHHKKN